MAISIMDAKFWRKIPAIRSSSAKAKRRKLAIGLGSALTGKRSDPRGKAGLVECITAIDAAVRPDLPPTAHRTHARRRRARTREEYRPCEAEESLRNSPWRVGCFLRTSQLAPNRFAPTGRLVLRAYPLDHMLFETWPVTECGALDVPSPASSHRRLSRLPVVAGIGFLLAVLTGIRLPADTI